MQRDDDLPPELAGIAEAVDCAAAISMAHPLDAPIDAPLARYRAALEAMVSNLAAIERTRDGALITLDKHAGDLSAAHIGASYELVASRKR